MQNEELSQQLWDTVLAFNAIRVRLLHTCFSTEVRSLADATCGLRDFIKGMKELIGRYETLLAGMEEPEGRGEAQAQEGAEGKQEGASTPANQCSVRAV